MSTSLPTIASQTSQEITGSPRVLRITCPVEGCGKACTRYNALQNHIQRDHEISIECEQMSFSSIDDFNKWKIETEQSDVSSYVKDTSAYKAKNEYHIAYYNCHRSHSSVEKKKKTFSRVFKSKKIGHACPSRIVCKMHNDGHINVDYYKTHVGHEKVLKFLPLDQNLKQNIKDKILAGEDADVIIKSIRNNKLLPPRAAMITKRIYGI
ncbi:uncharacterized protein LOC113367097 [Ctenocephalides felis]|uniref:uncharacterized protein LOC113367097 n=1 Tax=Ctenocephalides felis TaxID=7515 RepID=UPI000E6E1E91|nr:uncharacterized protein LOC113367097 [Ctenocephalides felis]